MMQDPVENKVLEWESKYGAEYREIHRTINYLSNRLFIDYDPLVGSGIKFKTRLNLWLENLKSEKDQCLLFKLIPNIFYLSPKDSKALYRDAYQTIYMRWLIDILNLSFIDPDIKAKIDSGILSSWFCPITDSFKISDFYHLNNIPGKNDFRPDWRSLAKLGDVERVKAIIEKENVKYLILLEDFIGNGNQSYNAVKFAVDNFPNLQILVIPLILCPEGEKASITFAEHNNNLTITPVVTFSSSCFISDPVSNPEDTFFIEILDLVKRCYPVVEPAVGNDKTKRPYGPLGYGDTGGLVVLNTNTPNNTLPIIHHHSSTSNWKPLFPRHIRA